MREQEHKIKLKWRLTYIKIKIKYYLKYYLCFGWYLSYIFKKKVLFRKMNRFENWVYYKYIAKGFHDYVIRNT